MKKFQGITGRLLEVIRNVNACWVLKLVVEMLREALGQGGLSKDEEIYFAMDKEIDSNVDKFANGRIEYSRWVGIYQMINIVIL